MKSVLWNMQCACMRFHATKQGKWSHSRQSTILKLNCPEWDLSFHIHVHVYRFLDVTGYCNVICASFSASFLEFKGCGLRLKTSQILPAIFNSSSACSVALTTMPLQQPTILALKYCQHLLSGIPYGYIHVHLYMYIHLRTEQSA